MSIDTWIISSNFKFKDISKAIEEIKKYNFHYEYNGLNEAKTIDEIFDLWTLTIKIQHDNACSVHSFGDCRGDEKELFQAIAPAIEKGGIVEIGVEFGEAAGDIVIVCKFDGNNCNVEYLYEETDEDTGKVTRRPFNQEEFC